MFLSGFFKDPTIPPTHDGSVKGPPPPGPPGQGKPQQEKQTNREKARKPHPLILMNSFLRFGLKCSVAVIEELLSPYFGHLIHQT